MMKGEEEDRRGSIKTVISAERGEEDRNVL